MEVPWTPEEFARKKDLLGPDIRLRRAGSMVIRGAECILASTFYNEDPYFTGPGIQRCTDVSETTITSTLQSITERGLLTTEETPEDAIYGARPPIRYKPVDNQGTSLFWPQRIPGCERTVATDVFDNLHPLQKQILIHIAQLVHHSGEVALINRPGISSMMGRVTEDNMRSVQLALKNLAQKDVIVLVDGRMHGRQHRARQYRLADRGRWLLAGIPASRL
jgi:hypothetical protein